MSRVKMTFFIFRCNGNFGFKTLCTLCKVSELEKSLKVKVIGKNMTRPVSTMTIMMSLIGASINEIVRGINEW